MTDETEDDENESDGSVGQFDAGGLLGSMVSGSFDTDANHELSEEVTLAIRLLKSGGALSDAADFLDEHDIDISELSPAEMDSLDRGEKQVVFAISAMAGSMEKFSKQVTDDDDGDNPFKVSDGDDPVY